MKTTQALQNLARTMRNNPTPMEYRMWAILRKSSIDGWKFRRQTPIGPYIVDFYCPKARLVIEIDGGGHTDQESDDAVRTAWLSANGFRVLRFTNWEVEQQIDAVYEEIRNALKVGVQPRSCVIDDSDVLRLL